MTEAITYTEVNGYEIPNLVMPDDGLGEEVTGQMLIISNDY